jgi:hypothetical protein
MAEIANDLNPRKYFFTFLSIGMLIGGADQIEIGRYTEILFGPSLKVENKLTEMVLLTSGAGVYKDTTSKQKHLTVRHCE